MYLSQDRLHDDDDDDGDCGDDTLTSSHPAMLWVNMQ
jgi:hypothetical protein